MASLVGLAVGAVAFHGPEPRSASVALPKSGAAVLASAVGGEEAIPPPPLVPRSEAHRFVGNDACAACHPRAVELHAKSTHAHTLFRGTDPEAMEGFRKPGSITDPNLKVKYSFRQEGGRPVFRVERTNRSGAVEVEPKYCLGSGHIGRTYLLEKGGVYMEARTSYFPRLKRWSWTPGQIDGTRSSSPVGATMSRFRTETCFMCHSTMLLREGDQVKPAESILNVGCERCHGPGADHVAAMRSGKKSTDIYGLRTASAAALMRLCGECHKSPVDTSEEQLKRFPALPRFAAPALSVSNCYKNSGGQLSCVTCHEPHSMRVESLDGPCMSCHSGQAGKWRPCPVNTKSGCVSCHMPLKSVDLPVGRQFRTHWIRVYPELRQTQAGQASAVSGKR